MNNKYEQFKPTKHNIHIQLFQMRTCSEVFHQHYAMRKKDTVNIYYNYR